ncbi:TPA: acyltransferase [Escherichia coli]|nr:acyltransferase [Escherichia coli]
MAILNAEGIAQLGLASCGENVYISDKASFYGASNIHIGSNVRIDDFCVLSAGEGGIVIGDYIHIAVYSSLIGKGKIYLGDFCNISSRVSIYSSSDDYSGESMSNPMVDDQFKNVFHDDVFLGKHVIVGTGSAILPGCRIEQGAAIGAMSLINNNCEAFSIYAGVPAQKIKKRSSKILSLELEFLKKAE